MFLSTWTWALIVSCIILLTYVAVTSVFRKRRKGEPPIAKGSLLWGNGADFSKNAVSFLHKCAKSYGDVFTLRLVNQYLHIVMDPHSYEAVSKEKNFDFDHIQRQVNLNVFSFILKSPRKMIKDTSRTVRGQYLIKGMRSFTNNLNTALVQMQPNQENNNQIGLREFASVTLFDALFNTIFGRSDQEQTLFKSQRVYKNFELFHRYFNFFWLGVPKNFFPSAMRALEELLCQPLAKDFLKRDDTSDYIKQAIEYMQMQGQTENEIKGHNLVYLHVNYNTFRLAFWTLYYMLENQKVYKVVREEIDDAIASRLDPDANSAGFTTQNIENLPFLDSVVTEASRLSSGVFMVRYVTEDTQFTTSQGETHLIRKGDRLAIYPPAIHKDPEIFEDPDTFKYDRFVDAKFYKHGQEIKNPVMPFGTLCTGKRYALLQLKWYIITTLNMFDMTLQEGQTTELDVQYHGHEIIPPTRDVTIDYEVRQSYPSLHFDS